MKALLKALAVVLSIFLFISCDFENKVQPELDETVDMDSISGADGETADEVTSDADVTEEKCVGCLINSVCYPNGVADPTNPCRKCDASSTSTGWTNDSEAVCNDGKFCTEDDKCSAGSCEGTVVDPDDGVPCNGVESCDEENGEITVDTTSGMCDEGQICDVSSGLCVDTCAGCNIDNICYGDGQFNPQNLCEFCNVEASKTQWSDNDGKTCDDGKFCTENDTCSAGTCQGTDIDPSDNTACNGTETCDEENDEIVVDTTTGMCNDDQICDVKGNRCIDECPGCFIEGVCYGNSQINPENVCSICDIIVSREEWTNLADDTVCDDGKFCTENDKCVSGTCKGTDIDPSDSIACNGVESCDEENNVIISTGNQCGGEEVCDMSSGECVETCPGCVIDSICYADKQINPSDACSFCDIEQTRTAWTDGFGTADNGKCSCDEGFEGRACTKEICAILVSPDGDDAEEGNSWETSVKTIQVAIQKAVINECDIWVKEGIYYESLELLDNIKIYGSFKGNETAPNERVVPQIEFEGRMVPDPTTIIDGGNVSTPLKCFLSSGCGDNVVIDGIAVKNGRSAEKGGGMYNNQTSPVIQNCLFDSNNAKSAGAVYNENASPYFKNTRFTNNATFNTGCNVHADHAGAIFNFGSNVTFENCTFDSNRAGSGGSCGRPGGNGGTAASPGGNGGNGGVMVNEGSSVIYLNNFFISNNAGNGGNGGEGGIGYYGGRGGNGGLGGSGGVIYNDSSSVTLINCALKENAAGMAGYAGRGGSGGEGGSGGHGGSAGNGAAIYSFSSTVTAVNTIITDNLIGSGRNGGNGFTGWITGRNGYGGNGGNGGSGALYGLGSQIDLYNVTIYNTSAGAAGNGGYSATPAKIGSPGIAGQGGWISSHGVSQVTILNSILWAGDIFVDVDTTATISYSDVETGCTSFADIQCGDGNIDTDPEFENASGGDYRLKDTSLCIDVGSNDLIAVDAFDLDGDNDKAELIPFDLSGKDRIRYTTVDMGAYEKELADPYVISLKVVSSAEIELKFNEVLDQTTAEEITNYVIDNGITVSAAVLEPTLKNTVTLTVDGFVQIDDYVLTVNNVTDVSGNLIATDSTENFSIAEFRPVIETVEILSASSVKVVFDRELDEASSQLVSNYVVDGLTVDTANLELSGTKEVTLNFTPDIDPEVTYTVVINGVLSLTGFEIVADSSAQFDKLPVVESYTVISGTEIEVIFSEQIDKTIAETVENYAIDNDVTVTSAVLEETENKKVTLTIDSFGESSSYILTINNIEDFEGNEIETDTEVNINIASFMLGISSVEVLSPTSIKLTFNNELEQILAETPENYTTEGLTVETATLEETGKVEVTLIFSTNILSGTYTLLVNELETTLGFKIIPDTSVEFEKPLPQSCSDIVLWGDSEGNGSYTIYHNGEETRDWTVYCDDMSGEPKDFVTLPNTGGSYNFSRYAAGGATTGNDLITYYTKLKINPETLNVSVNDMAYSLTTGGPLSNGYKNLSYGGAYSCKAYDDASGTGNIDLVGTNLKVAPGEFLTDGWYPAGGAVYSSNNQIVSITGGGYCGNTVVSGGLLQLEIIE